MRRITSSPSTLLTWARFRVSPGECAAPKPSWPGTWNFSLTARFRWLGGETWIPTGSQTINSFLPLKSDLWLTSYGLYLIELVNQFTADHVENRRLFRLLLDTMHNLCQPVNKELTLRYFELHLLHEVGYRPQLQWCVLCHTPLKPVTNSFCPSAGGILCPDCTHTQPLTYPLSVNALKVLRLLQGSDYQVVSKLKMDPRLSQEIEIIMRNYLKYLLERDVKSVAWLDTLKEQIKQTTTGQVIASDKEDSQSPD